MSVNTDESSSFDSREANVIKKQTEVHLTISDEEEQLGRTTHDYANFPTSRGAYF